MHSEAITAKDPSRITHPSLEGWDGLRLIPTSTPKPGECPKYALPAWLDQRLDEEGGELVCWAGSLNSVISQEVILGSIPLASYTWYPPEPGALSAKLGTDGEEGLTVGSPLTSSIGRVSLLKRADFTRLISLVGHEYIRYSFSAADASTLEVAHPRARGMDFQQVQNLDRENEAPMARALLADRLYQPSDPAQHGLLARLRLATSVELGRISKSDQGKLRPDDLPLACFGWVCVSPPGTVYSRDVFKFRPRAYPPGCWGLKAPPALLKFTAGQRAAYERFLKVENQHYDYEFASRNHSSDPKTEPTQFWRTPLQEDPSANE